jgi:uncharacterized protein (DUF58 family)
VKNGRLRPLNPIGPIAGSIVTLLAWSAIAHNSGSGWVQALGAVLGAALLVGILGPGWVVAKASVGVVSVPSDALSGEEIKIEVVATSRVRIRPVEPNGKTGFAGPTQNDPSPIAITPERRGILVAVTFDVASAAPFGILWWSRRTTVALPSEICVSPKPTSSIWIPPENEDWAGESPGRRTSSVGETRGVRDYVHGDAKRSVHWRASAHTGRLMIREMQAPNADPVTVHVALPADPDAADELAGRALATLLDLLGRSRPVMLATHEATGDRLQLVLGPREAGRRLARAIARGSGPGELTIDEPR